MTATDGGNSDEDNDDNDNDDDDNDNGPLVQVAGTAGNRPEPVHLELLGPWQWTTPDAVKAMGRQQIEQPPREIRVFLELRVF